MRLTKEDFELLLKDYITPLHPVLSNPAVLGEEESGNIAEADIRRSHQANYGFAVSSEYKGKPGLLFCIHQASSKPADLYAFAYCPDTLPSAPGHINNFWAEMTSALFSFQPDRKRYTSNERKCYIRSLCNMAILIALCKTLNGADKEASATMLKVIYELEEWATKTYEGTKIPFGFIIDRSIMPGEGQDYTEFLKTKHSALFTDGMFSAIMLDKTGKISNYIPLVSNRAETETDRLPFCPSRFSEFSRRCTGNKVGIIALSNGDIMIYQNNMLAYTRRSGTWGAWHYYHFKHAIKTDSLITTNELLLKNVYISLMNASFSHCGACFAVVTPDKEEDARKLIGLDCVLSAAEYKTKAIGQKNLVIKELITDPDSGGDLLKFQEINEKLRTELMGLDGAFVVDTEGNIIAVGAILSVAPGSDEGGRSAASKALSNYGIGIKVSEDGDITVYRSEEQILKFFNDPSGLA